MVRFGFIEDPERKVAATAWQAGKILEDQK
jgi:hypothetical protein